MDGADQPTWAYSRRVAGRGCAGAGLRRRSPRNAAPPLYAEVAWVLRPPRQSSCDSMCSAEDTRYSPGASTCTCFTTPSSAYNANRFARVPMP